MRPQRPRPQDRIRRQANALEMGQQFAGRGHSLGLKVRLADITGDGVVSVNDLLTVINSWGPCPKPPTACPADNSPPPNGDGVVNVNDLLMVLNNWG